MKGRRIGERGITLVQLYLLSGLFGAVLMYAGDMLLYGTTEKLPMANADGAETVLFFLRCSSSGRLLAGGLLGPLAAAFAIVGFLHIPALALPEAKIWADLLFCLFTLAFALGGAYHMAWIFLGDAARRDDPVFLAAVMERFFRLKPIVFGLLSMPTFALSLFVLFECFPVARLYVLLTPTVLLFFMPLLRKIPQPWGIWIWGGWCNLVFAVYYAVMWLILD